MSSICWAEYETSSGIKADLRRRAYLALFFALLWSVNLSIVFFGLPFIIFGKLSAARRRAAS